MMAKVMLIQQKIGGEGLADAVNPIAHIFCHVKQMQSSFVALSTILPKLHVLNLGTYLPAEGGSDGIVRKIWTHDVRITNSWQYFFFLAIFRLVLLLM